MSYLARAVNIFRYGILRQNKYRQIIGLLKHYNIDVLTGDPAVFFDVGANEGQTSLQINRLQKFKKLPLACHSFEPFQSAFETLSSQPKLMAQKERFHFHQLGLSNRREQLKVQRAPSSNLNSIEMSGQWEHSNDFENISVTTLDQFIDSMAITFPIVLKIDTEGHELSVLEGGQNGLKSRQIKLIILETGFNSEDRTKSFFPDVFSFLLENEYRCCGFDEITAWPDPRWNATPSIGLCNAWFSAPVTQIGLPDRGPNPIIAF
jgi:FkbM family methyltransferase